MTVVTYGRFAGTRELMPSIRTGLCAVSLLTIAACASSEPTPAAAPRAGTDVVASPVPVILPFGDFVERRGTSRPTRTSAGGGATLAIIDDQRVAFDAQGRVTGASESPPQSRGVVAIPSALGGGFAIHGASGIFRTETPFGPLKRLVAFSVQSLSFGPRGALVELDDGRLRLVDLEAGSVSPVAPLGAVSMAVAGPRLAGALIEDGSALISRDGGNTWVAAPAHPHRFTELLVEEGSSELILVDTERTALRVEERRLSPVSSAPQRATPAVVDPRWVGDPDPLEATVSRGTVLDDARAIVSSGGAIFVIDRGSGAIQSVEPGALPPNRTCTALGFSRDILFVCPDDGRVSVLRRPRSGGPVETEITFAGSGHLVRGDGDALLYTGTCEGDATQVGAACLRKKDGTWAPIDRTGLFAAQPGGVVLAWVPTDESALAILGGDAFGILDAGTGERSVLDKPVGQKLASLVPARSDAVEHRLRVVHGAIEGWSSNGDFIRIEKGGALVKIAPFKMSGVRFAGPHGLAAGPAETLWQTSDWGKTFVEVPTPPFRIGQPYACGEAGCIFSQWMRRGWSDERARPTKRDRKAQAAITLPKASLPALRCTVSGPQSTRSRAPDESGTPLGLGGDALRAGEIVTTFADGPDGPMGRIAARDEIRALESGPPSRAPEGVLEPTSSRRIRFTSPFDPSATIQTATYRASDLVEGARRAGDARPTTAELEGSGHAIAVLVAPGAPAELLLYRDSIALGTWLRGKDSVVLSMRTSEVDLGMAIGAARRGDALTMLVSSSSADATIVAAGPGHMEKVFGVPGPSGPGPRTRTMDALGIGANGEAAILRMHARTPPDASDPALLLTASAPPSQLAAWSTLTADGAPGCESAEGVRAVVTTDPPWIQLGAAPPDDGLMMARVRWSASRVCLEAVEITNATHDTPAGSATSRIIATFGAKAQAGLAIVAPGVELREPRACQLLGAPRASGEK